VIDWHSHILPALDDGSKNPEESVAMIGKLASQGAKIVIATPHFFANDQSVASFINKRDQAFASIKKRLPENSPEIRLGAEVRYYPGISRLLDLKALRIEGSNLLLLEMPMMCWTQSMMKELSDLSAVSGIQLVLAHVERYLALQKKDTLNQLLGCGILMQVNANSFIAMSTRRKVLSLLKKGCLHFIGSDCHNMKSRPPKLLEAYALIEKKLGCEFVAQMNEFGYAMLDSIK
jgi:protein-tyrosine phosphatase